MNTIILTENTDHFHISLNRPEKRNALNTEMMTELIDCLAKLSQKIENQKFLVLTGEGKSFCAGADLNWMKAMVNYSLEENKKDSELLFETFNSVFTFPLSVVCKVQGHVFGGGLGLLAAADYCLANKDTVFSFSEVKLGLIPAVISSFVLNKANLSYAKAFMTSGERFSTSQAMQLGLVQKELTQETYNLVCESYNSAGTQALIETKKLIQEQICIKPEGFKEKTIDAISNVRVSEEAQKRMNDFLNR